MCLLLLIARPNSVIFQFLYTPNHAMIVSFGSPRAKFCGTHVCVCLTWVLSDFPGFLSYAISKKICAFSSCLVLVSVQHHAERLRMSDSPLQHMQRVFSGVEGINEAELRRQLGELSVIVSRLFPPDRVFDTCIKRILSSAVSFSVDM